jgi:hypothetical protein
VRILLSSAINIGYILLLFAITRFLRLPFFVETIILFVPLMAVIFYLTGSKGGAVIVLLAFIARSLMRGDFERFGVVKILLFFGGAGYALQLANYLEPLWIGGTPIIDHLFTIYELRIFENAAQIYALSSNDQLHSTDHQFIEIFTWVNNFINGIPNKSLGEWFTQQFYPEQYSTGWRPAFGLQAEGILKVGSLGSIFVILGVWLFNTMARVVLHFSRGEMYLGIYLLLIPTFYKLFRTDFSTTLLKFGIDVCGVLLFVLTHNLSIFIFRHVRRLITGRRYTA